MLPGRKYQPEDVLAIAWKRKWFILIPFVLIASAVAVGLRFIPDLYRSETLILVIPQRVPESYVQSTVTARLQDRLQSIQQQILSRTRLERIIMDFDLYPQQRASGVMEDVVESMRNNDVRVNIVRGDAFQISYVSEDPATAQKVAERLASFFIEENLRDRAALAEGTNQFLDTQLQEARARLIEQEKRLEAFRMRHGGELPAQAQSNLQALQNLQLRGQGLQDSIARDRDRRLILERQLAEAESVLLTAGAAPSPSSPRASGAEGNTAAATAEQQLATARSNLQILEMRLKPEHPDIGRTKRLIADLEKKAEAERNLAAVAAEKLDAGGPGAARMQLSGPARRVADLREEVANVDREIKAKEAQIAAVQRESAGYQGRLEAIPTRESELVELMRDYGTTEHLYQDLLGKREQSKIASNLERRQIGEQFKVLDPARRPERPFSPNRPLLMGLGSAVGLGVGLALVALLEFRDRSFKSEADVISAISLPVLASIPRMHGMLERRQSWRRRAISGTALVLLVVAAGVLVVRFLR